MWYGGFVQPLSRLKHFHDVIKTGFTQQADECREELSRFEKYIAPLKEEQQRLRSGRMTIREIEARLKWYFSDPPTDADDLDNCGTDIFLPEDPRPQARLDSALDNHITDYLVEIAGIEQTLKDIKTSWTNYASYLVAVILYTRIEVSLLSFCGFIAKEKGISPFKKKKGQGLIEQVESYVKTVLQLKWPEGKHAEELKALSALRNAILHEDGMLAGGRKTCSVIAEHLQGRLLSTDAEGRVFLSEKYIEHAIHESERFFSELGALNPEAYRLFGKSS